MMGLKKITYNKTDKTTGLENLGAQSAFGNNSTRDNSSFKWTDYALFQILIFIEELY